MNEKLFKKFLEKAKSKFGDKFDYSKVDYISSNSPVIIVCPIHGEFKITPVRFLQSKYGCRNCAIEESTKKRTLTTEGFIKKAKDIWGERFSYEKTEYINSDTKVIVTCPIHGEFLTRPADFLRKHGCPKCKNDKTSKLNQNKRMTQEQFLERSFLLYGNLFSYENTRYINKRTKIVIHSNLLNEDFIVSPDNFFRAEFPAKYRGECVERKDSYTNEEFIRIAKLIRPEYDYSKAEYKNLRTNIVAICPEHGEFEITPCNLLYNNEGCPNCSCSKGESYIKNLLDCYKLQYKQQYPLEINEHKLKIDFCLFINNNIIFIEYNGRQHYEPVKYFGGEVQFKKQVERDNLLREYCKKHNITLLEYKYDIPFYKLHNIIKEDLNKIKDEQIEN